MSFNVLVLRHILLKLYQYNFKIKTLRLFKPERFSVGPAGFEPATKELQVFIFLGYDSVVIELLILYHQIIPNFSIHIKQ
jgi:hypothetical protein